jgi:hypothetical protein
MPVTELVTESLQGGGKSVKSGNRNVWIPGDLRFDGGIPKVACCDGIIGHRPFVLNPFQSTCYAPYAAFSLRSAQEDR